MNFLDSGIRLSIGLYQRGFQKDGKVQLANGEGGIRFCHDIIRSTEKQPIDQDHQ
jgi:hypothetical protein